MHKDTCVEEFKKVQRFRSICKCRKFKSPTSPESDDFSKSCSVLCLDQFIVTKNLPYDIVECSITRSMVKFEAMSIKTLMNILKMLGEVVMKEI